MNHLKLRDINKNAIFKSTQSSCSSITKINNVYNCTYRGITTSIIKQSDIIHYITNNKISIVETYLVDKLFSILSSCKLKEICILIDCPYKHQKEQYQLPEWDIIFNLFKTNFIPRFSFINMNGYYPRHILKMMEIPTLISFNIIAIDDKGADKIIKKLKKSYHILEFKYGCERTKYAIDVLLFRNRLIHNKSIHSRVLNFAIVMSTIFDAPYVILEIFDWLEYQYNSHNAKNDEIWICPNHLANHRLKIGIIEKVCNFRRSNQFTIKNIL